MSKSRAAFFAAFGFQGVRSKNLGQGICNDLTIEGVVMKTKLKFTCLVLTLVIAALLFFVACDSDESGGGEQVIEADTPNYVPATLSDDDGDIDIDPRLLVYDNLPERDFDGADFRILYPAWANYLFGLYFSEELETCLLGGAIFMRQLNVEDRFNVNIVPIRIPSIFDVYSTVSRTVMAGDDAFDLVLTHCIAGVAPMVTSGIVADWNSVPYLDFAKPWWNQRIHDELSIHGVLLTGVSDFIILDPNVIYFNKQMIIDYDLPCPYELVRSGRWTWDALYEMAAVVTKDLNGDGIMDENDQFGFVTMVDWMMESAIHAYGLSITRLDEVTGERVLDLHNPLFFELLDTLNALMFGPNTFIASWDANTAQSPIPMCSGRVLFHMEPLWAAITYRASEVDFGILPIPKRAGMDEYLSLSWNGFMMIPITANLDKVGIIS